MKNIFVVCCLLILAISSFAEDVRRVAILETVDRQGNVAYVTKLMLRSSLAKAITNTPGYEAYDRSDMDAIMGEQNFQRTGMVSNDQIKRLGEMTGAKYVLVAEAAIIGDDNMFITAKLLDVESARTIITDNKLMGTSAKEIQQGCQILAEILIKPIVVPIVETKSSNVTPTKLNIKESVVESPVSKNEPIEPPAQVNQELSNLRYIIKISNNEYMLAGSFMDKEAYQHFIHNNCPEAWQKHCKAKRLVNAGWGVFSVGLLATTLTSINSGMALTSRGLGGEKLYATCIVGGVGVAATFFVGIPLLSTGYKRMNNTYKAYNMYCVSSASTVNTLSLNLQADEKGLGLTLHF